MNLDQWLAFISASLILFLIPGPDMILVAGWSATGGFRSGMKAALGTVSGILVHTCTTALGLAAILAASATAFAIIKWVGALYLLYLGVMTLTGGGEQSALLSGKHKKGNPYAQALLTNVLNPKVVLFFLAFLPQFVAVEQNTVAQLFILGTVFAFIAAVGYLGLILISIKAGSKIGQNRTLQVIARWLGGSVLIAFGVRLALEGKH